MRPWSIRACSDLVTDGASTVIDAPVRCSKRTLRSATVPPPTTRQDLSVSFRNMGRRSKIISQGVSCDPNRRLGRAKISISLAIRSVRNMGGRRGIDQVNSRSRSFDSEFRQCLYRTQHEIFSHRSHEDVLLPRSLVALACVHKEILLHRTTSSRHIERLAAIFLHRRSTGNVI